MKSKISDEVLLVARIHEDSHFVEFRLNTQRHKANESSWVLERRIVDQLGAEASPFVSKIDMNTPPNAGIPSYLENITVIDSRPPGAARAEVNVGDPYSDLLKPLLKEFGIGHTYVTTESAESIEEFAGGFSDPGTVIIFGGDTSIHEFVNGLKPSTRETREVRIIVIPTGTGNALSISCGFSTPINAIRRLFLSEKSDFVPLSTLPVRFHSKTNRDSGKQNVDTPLQKEHRALVVVSWGLHSALVADSDTPEMRAAFKDNPNDRFKEAARINLAEVLQRYHGEVSLLTNHGTEHVFGPEHSYLLFTIVTYLEDRFLISPSSHPPSDNCAHMVAIKPFRSLSEQKEQIMKIMSEVYDQGNHVNDPLVDYRALKGVIRVEVGAGQCEKMRRWCIDGKIVCADAGVVEIGAPSSHFNGWSLLVLQG